MSGASKPHATKPRRLWQISRDQPRNPKLPKGLEDPCQQSKCGLSPMNPLSFLSFAFSREIRIHLLRDLLVKPIAQKLREEFQIDTTRRSSCELP